VKFVMRAQLSDDALARFRARLRGLLSISVGPKANVQQASATAADAAKIS
jgi:hypothetical protein